jgi:hypothetical protein
MKLIDLLPVFGAITLAILCYFLSGYVPQTASGGLLVIAGALAGWSIPRLSDLGKKVALVFVLVFASSTLSACKTTPTNPDSFYQTVVTCTVDNSSNTQAGAAVYKCLAGVVTSDYTACLAGLVTAGYWTVDEVACIVRHYAQTSAQRMNAGTGDPMDPKVLDNANAWLKQEQIRFKAAQ